MAHRQKKQSETCGTSEISSLGDSPLLPLGSVIPSHRNDLEGIRFEDKTLLNPRSSVESDASLSYPSHEPSLLEKLRSGLSQGMDVHTLLNSKKVRKNDITINFSLSSSSGSISSADLTLPPERRQTTVFTRRKRSNMTINLTLNDTSSCDNQENESPVLPNERPKSVFRKPAVKKMSIRINDASESDSSKASIHEDSLPILDPESRTVPLKSSLRSRATANKNMTMNLSLDNSESCEKSIDEDSSKVEPSSSAPNILTERDSLPKLGPKSRQLPLRSSRSKAGHDKNMTFDVSLDSTKGNERSVDEAILKDDVEKFPGASSKEEKHHNAVQINDQTFTVDVRREGKEIEGDTPSKSKLDNVINASNVHSPQISDQTVSTDADNHELDALAVPTPHGLSSKPGHVTDQNFVMGVNDDKETLGHKEPADKSNVITNDAASVNDDFLVEPSTPPVRQGSPRPEDTPVLIDEAAVLTSRASVQNPVTPIAGPPMHVEVSETPLPKEMDVVAPLFTERTDFSPEIDGIEPVGQFEVTEGESQPKNTIEDSLNLRTTSKQDEELVKVQYSPPLKREQGKNRFSVNFTLSNTTSTDNDVTLPKFSASRAERLLKKNNKKFSIPIQFGDGDSESTTVGDAFPHIIQSDDQGKHHFDEDEGDVDDVGSPQLTASTDSASLEANDSNISLPMISGKLPNPLTRRLASHRISISFKGDDSVFSGGSPNSRKAADRGEVSDAHLIEQGTDNENTTNGFKGSVCSTKSIDEANEDGTASFLLPSSIYVNPLSKKRLERNKISVACKLEDTVNDSEVTSNGVADKDNVRCDDVGECSKLESSCRNPSASGLNLEYSKDELGNSKIVEPDVPSSSSHFSDAVSLRCSLDDVPRSSNDYSSDSLKNYRNVCAQPHEANNISIGKSPSMEEHSGVSFRPECDQSADDLRLELSLTGSLQYSGVDSSGIAMMEPDDAGEEQRSLLELGNAEELQHHQTSTHTSRRPPVLPAKNPAPLRRSKRGSKNVTIVVDSSDSKSSVSGPTGLVRKPHKKKSTHSKMSIAVTDQINNSSSVPEPASEALCGRSTDESQKVSTPNSTLSAPNEVFNSVLHNSAGSLQDQSELQIHDGISSKVPTVPQICIPQNANRDDTGDTPPDPADANFEEPKTANAVNEFAVVELDEVGNESSAPISKNPSLSKVRRSKRLSNLSMNGDLSVVRHTNESVESDHHSKAASPLAISEEPESVALSGPENQNSYQNIEEDKADGKVSPLPTASQTSPSSLHLHVTTFHTDADNAINKSHCTVPQASPVQQPATMSLVKPAPSNATSAKGVNTPKEADALPEPTGSKRPPETEELVIGEAETRSTCLPHHENASQTTNGPCQQEGSSAGEPQRIIRHKPFSSSNPASLFEAPMPYGKNSDDINEDHIIPNGPVPKPAGEKVEQKSTDNEDGPPPSNLVPIAGPSGISVKDDQPEAIPQTSKRKSVSFKPSTENLYHSPPDHSLFQDQDQNADGKAQVDGGYEFSRIQMTTEISEIQLSPTVKRARRHFSSTPVSKSKKSGSPTKPNDDVFVQPQSKTSGQPTNHQFLVPPTIPLTKRVSIHPVPEIIAPTAAALRESGVVVDAVQGSSESGSSYDLSCENSLEISAIPKEVNPLRGNVVYHSTPLHRTKSSIKRTKKKAELPPQVPPIHNSLMREEDEAKVANHSVQTSRNLRSRSKTSLESGSSSDHTPAMNASVPGSLRRSGRRKQTPGRLVGDTPKSGEESAGKDPADGSPADRISIQDNTIVSTRIESQSRARGSRSRSTAGSMMKSYDSHRKMTSRRLFTDAGEPGSSADPGHPSEGTESSPPKSTDVVPPESNDITSASQQGDDELLSNSAPSISLADQPSYPRTDENVSILFAQQPEDISDTESVISTVSAGSSSSIPSYVVTRQSFESQLSSLRLRSKHRGRQEVGTDRADPPKPRSKYAITRPSEANLNLIYPELVPVKKRKRSQSTAVKLFNPGAKWKKSKKLYAWLKNKLKPEYKLRTNYESERLVIELDHARKLVSQGHKEHAIDWCVERLHRLNICTNQLELWSFFVKFMPFDFVKEVVPMGGAFGQPFDPEDSFLPFDPIYPSS